ncbi:MAG: dienelactone hydrolase family protein [Balneolaceae bacterium]|nr:dienelactone hydrolase family protein [Balneolaceae bacterium]
MAQDYAMEQLENSPRHHEWVDVEYDGRTVHSFVAYPETNEETPAVIVIHENRGLNDWARSFTDQVAKAGYIAIAPDLLSGFSDEYERTTDFPIFRCRQRRPLHTSSLNRSHKIFMPCGNISATYPLQPER